MPPSTHAVTEWSGPSQRTHEFKFPCVITTLEPLTEEHTPQPNDPSRPTPIITDIAYKIARYPRAFGPRRDTTNSYRCSCGKRSSTCHRDCNTWRWGWACTGQRDREKRVLRRSDKLKQITFLGYFVDARVGLLSTCPRLVEWPMSPVS